LDYRASARLLMQYLDNHMLPGYAAVANDLVTGYVFCIYEETKAVIGDVFAMADQPANGTSTHELEETLLRHLLELLVNSPQVERIESQLLVHPSGLHAAVFREAGCKLYRRLFMMHPLKDLWTPPQVDLPSELELRPWRDEDLAPPPGSSQRPIETTLTAHQRPVPLCTRLHALPQQHRALRRLRNLLRTHLSRSRSPHQS